MRTDFIATLALVMVTSAQAKKFSMKNFLKDFDKKIAQFETENPDFINQLNENINEANK